MEELTKFDFHFRLSKEFGLATNSETGEKAEVYVMTSFETRKEIPEEKLPVMHETIRKDMVEKWDCDDSWITSITKEEYEAQSYDEEMELEIESE